MLRQKQLILSNGNRNGSIPSRVPVLKDPAIITGHIFFGALILQSLIFSMERILFADCAFHLYQFINEQDFQVFNLRFISVLTQVVPISGVMGGWPLETLVKAYSLSFSVLYYIYFILVAHVARDRAVAVAIILFHSIFILHSFFWIQSEFPQGLMLLFFAYALFRKRGAVWNGLFALLLIPVLFSHPMMLFPVIFLMLFDLRQTDSTGKYFYWTLILFAIAIFILKSNLPFTAYEGSRISFKKLWRNLPGIFQSDTFGIFIKWLLRDYFMLLIGLLATVVYYLRKRLYGRCALLLAFFIGYAVLVILSYPDIKNDRLQFYFENLCLPLGFFVALPLSFDIIMSGGFFTPKRLAVAGACVFKIFLIVMISKSFTARLDYLANMIKSVEKFPEKKFVMPASLLDMDVIRLEWALPCETMIYSSLSDKTATITIAQSRDAEDARQKGTGNVLEPFRIISQGGLNPAYFNISGEDYRVLAASDLKEAP